MKNITAQLVCVATMAVATGTVQAATYIKYDGEKGNSGYSGAVSEWQWLQAMSDNGEFNGFAPSFAGSDYVESGDVSGDGLLDEMVLTVSSDRAGQETYYTYKLKNVLVSSYQVSGTGAASFTLDSFASATMTWLPPTPNGGRGDAIVGQWDRATGRFSGDLAVLGAFDDLGVERWADGTLALTAAVPEPGSWALMLLGVAALGTRLRQRRTLA